MPETDLPLDGATADTPPSPAVAGPPKGPPAERKPPVSAPEPEPTGWKRSADFACKSIKCRTPAGEAKVYELPVGSTHCPFGHKRLMQLFNKVAVIGTRSLQPPSDPRLTSSSRFQRSQVNLQPAFDHADKFKLQDKSMRSHIATGRERQVLAKVLGLPGGESKPMTPTDIKRTMLRDPFAPSSLMARQWNQGIPMLVKDN